MFSNLFTNFTNYGIHQRTHRREVRGLREDVDRSWCAGLRYFFNTQSQMEDWELPNGYAH